MSKSHRESILGGFERLVARYGLDKVTMKDLAKEAGVSVGAIYLHFNNKDALIVAIEERWRSHVELRNAAIIESDRTAEEKLHEIVVEHVERFSSLIRKNQAVFELLLGAIRLRYIKRDLVDTRKEIFDLMIASTAQVLKEGCDAGEFDVEDINSTAELFVKAFAEYFSPSDVIKRKHPEVVRSAKAMFELLMKAIKSM